MFLMLFPVFFYPLITLQITQSIFKRNTDTSVLVSSSRKGWAEFPGKRWAGEILPASLNQVSMFKTHCSCTLGMWSRDASRFFFEIKLLKNLRFTPNKGESSFTFWLSAPWNFLELKMGSAESKSDARQSVQWSSQVVHMLWNFRLVTCS